jgi:hypothetical protein
MRSPRPDAFLAAFNRAPRVARSSPLPRAPQTTKGMAYFPCGEREVAPARTILCVRPRIVGAACEHDGLARSQPGSATSRHAFQFLPSHDACWQPAYVAPLGS